MKKLPPYQPSIYIGDIEITDPSIVATDMILAAICIAAFFKIKQLNDNGTFIKNMKYYFLLLGISAFLGGIFAHAFRHALSDNWKLLSWPMSLVAIYFLEIATLTNAKSALSKNAYSYIKKLIIVELLAALVYLAKDVDVKYLEWHTMFGIVFISFPLSLYAFIKRKSQYGMYFMIAFALLLLNAVVYFVPISLHIRFNQVDLAHIIIGASVWVMMLGAKKESSAIA